MRPTAYITTAPRAVPTLARTVESLWNAGINLSFHPDADPPIGAFRHWLRVLEIAQRTEGHGNVLICQDDIIVAQSLGRIVSGFRWPSNSVGIYSFYCPAKYASAGPGWVLPDGSHPIGACCLFVRSDIISALLNSETAYSWKSNKGIDKFLGEALKELGLRMCFHSPSLVQHIGEISTLDGGPAAGWRAASDFVGENYSELLHF